jgi:SNF2 family DNA or RNA helicase
MQASLLTESVLRAHANRAGAFADLLARQALRAADGGGLEVASAALDELLVRFDRARRGDIDRADVGRDDGTVGDVGWFEIDGREVWIGSRDPLEASCSCNDFIRSSLGACVHVFVALRCGIASSQRPLDVRWEPIRGPDCVQPWTARVRGSGDVVAPALHALRERDRKLQNRHVAVADVHAQLATLRVPLFAYQRAGVEAFFRTGRMVLADDMCLGKTVQAVAIGHVLFGLGLIERALVIVPASLERQWRREWERFSPTRAEVTSYERARRGRSFEAFDFVILDEAQRIKNASTLTARELMNVQPKWRLALTGTPLENRLDELASIVAWIDDHALAPTWRLRSWHVVRSSGRHKRVVGVRGLDTIRARIAPHFLRRMRAEVIAALPGRRDTAVPAPMSPPHRDAHDALQAALARVASGPPTRDQHLRIQRLVAEQRLVCNGVALARFPDYWNAFLAGRIDVSALHAPKLTVLRELLTALVIEQRRKVIVFSQWRRMLLLAERAVADLEIEGVYFTGAESMRAREQNIARFHDTAQVLWSTDAAALGLNLQLAANCCVNLELPWNPATLEQRVARIYRLGQTSPVDVYNLVTVDGIEGRISQLLATKQSLFDTLFEGTDDALHFNGATRGHSLALALGHP